MSYLTQDNGTSLTLVGQNEYEGTFVTIPMNDLKDMNSEQRGAHLDRVFVDTHTQRIRIQAGIGWRAAQ